jgi:hypothetical protein
VANDCFFGPLPWAARMNLVPIGWDSARLGMLIEEADLRRQAMTLHHLLMRAFAACFLSISRA